MRILATLVFLLPLLAIPAAYAQSRPDPGEAEELGRVAGAATLCALDPPWRVARQIGIQLSSGLIAESVPEDLDASLASFGDGEGGFRREYAAADDVERSRMCAIGWLGWRAIRSASTMSVPAIDFAAASKLAKNSGIVHGWLWACQLKGGLENSPAREISRQSGLSIAMAALHSSSVADLNVARDAWRQGFSLGLADPPAASEGSTSDCKGVEQAAAKLALAFTRPEIVSAIVRARASRFNILGGKV